MLEASEIPRQHEKKQNIPRLDKGMSWHLIRPFGLDISFVWPFVGIRNSSYNDRRDPPYGDNPTSNSWAFFLDLSCSNLKTFGNRGKNRGKLREIHEHSGRSFEWRNDDKTKKTKYMISKFECEFLKPSFGGYLTICKEFFKNLRKFHHQQETCRFSYKRSSAYAEMPKVVREYWHSLRRQQTFLRIWCQQTKCFVCNWDVPPNYPPWN